MRRSISSNSPRSRSSLSTTPCSAWRATSRCSGRRSMRSCAVPLEHLAEYTAKLTDIFAKHGTRGTWYAHASVGCLHVRPVLNLRREHDVKAMRAIAEEALDMVLAYKGSHSGEHGDGIVRSEFHEKMFGPRLVRAFEELKQRFDPKGFYNPGKIVRAPKFDDRTL